MAYQEKINIYVPHEIGLQLKNDAKLFEIFKKDRRTINLNRFLSMILCGYYDQYCHENKEIHDSIMTIMDSVLLDDNMKEEIADQIVNQVFLPAIPKRKGKKPICLSLKPTNDTERIIQNVLRNLMGKDFISQYFCRMLISYCKKPISQRERIVFKENYDKLQLACQQNVSVTFSLIWDDKSLHEVLPYAIATGPEEMFNYLVGEGTHYKTGEPVACSFRLNRIDRLSFGRTNRPIAENIRIYCARMLETAPQYAINAEEEICVRLNDAGEKLYNRIYYGRPAYERIEDREDGHYYFFSCSSTQVFHYFRRFDNMTAKIISPEYAQERMIRFHENALSQYQEEQNGN